MPEGCSYLHLKVLLFEPPDVSKRLRSGRFMGTMDFPISPREWSHDVAEDMRRVLTAEMPEALANMSQGTLLVVPEPPHPNSYPLLFVLKDGRLA